MSTTAAKPVTTAFGVASSPNKMTQFIQEVVAPRIFQRTKLQQRFVNLVNREYEGVVKGKGDQVRIFDVGPIYAGAYARGSVPQTAAEYRSASGNYLRAPVCRGLALAKRGTLTYQTLVGNAMTVTVTEGDYYGFEVEDIETFLANPKYVQKAIENAGDALARSADRWIFGQMLTAASTSTANAFGFQGGSYTGATSIYNKQGTATDASANAIYYNLVDLGAKMDDNLVPEEGRWITIPSFAKAAFLKSPLFVGAAAAGSQSARDKGYLGDIAGFKVITIGRNEWSDYSVADASGNMYKWATASASGNVAYANGEVHANSVRDLYKSVDGAMTVVDHSGNYNTLYGVAGHNDAYTFIDALTKTEQLRLEGSFADAWRGLHVYGGGAVRPNWLFKASYVDNVASIYTAE